MNKDNSIKLFLITIIFLLTFSFFGLAMNIDIIELTNEIEDIKEQQNIIQGLFNAHLTNTLSKDFGGEIE